MRPTGGGKSLVFTASAACIKGITLSIMPLLTLGSNQFENLINKTESDHSITAFHLDELTKEEVENTLFPKLLMLSSENPVVLFTSPQCILYRYNHILEKLISLKLIRFVVVDEIHLFNHFGRSFRKEFTELKESLFQKSKIIILQYCL